ncbi:putative bifunctional diguanylate cyclase/phosphodiesterase [Methylocystis parvus]|uniref:putative bifunctional diguanylate cyclase/phosphodiesterase n=1 Tax=Methylocystis parvus TaxID=134 RepID=UPI003C787921
MQLRHIANRGAEAPVATSIRSSILKAPLQAAPQPAAAPVVTPEPVVTGPDPRQILASIGEVVYSWDIGTDRLTWGPNLAKILGPIASSDLGTGLAYGERVAREGGASRYDAIVQSDQIDRGDGVAYQTVYALSQPREFGPGPVVWVEDTGRWYAGEDGRPARAHGVVRVVTERHEMERKLALGSQIDPLTGVLNRAQLSEHVNRFLVQAERTRKPFAVLLVALENLFSLNRTYGYDAGDEVIAGLARRLRDNVRTCDVVARHAGNKFALVLENCDTEQTLSVANRLLDFVKSRPFETSAGAIPATIRIGGVIGPREGRQPRVLFQHAEEALDVARQGAGKRFVAYTSSLAREDARLRALQVADNIVSALNDRRVELAFQPIVNAATGDVAFHEALLRVRLPDGAAISPGALLPVAEKAGLVRLLDQRVMELVMERLVAEPELRVSVNCSMNTVLDPEWPDRLAAAIGVNPSIPDRLIVEITETCMIEDFETTKNLIAACKQLGVKVAMDDFGAGHTSFRSLRDLAFDIVKIDGAFIQNIATSADDRFFVRTLIDLARHLSLKVVAEWVEDEATARILRDWGVEYFQGALYGRAEERPAVEEKRQLAAPSFM